MREIRFFLTLIFLPFLVYSQSWKQVGTGITGQNGNDFGVFKLFTDTANHVLYAGGGFDHAGGAPAQNIAKWDGVNWFPLGAGVNFTVTAITVFNNEVYVGGINSNKVWKWDGANWTSLPPFGNGSDVNVLSVVNNEFYAGGTFIATTGNLSLNKIAKWTGTTWDSLGVGVGGCACSTYIDAIVEYQGNLIAAGVFWTAGGDTAFNIARWDGFYWHPLGLGVNAPDPYNADVFDLYSDGSDLYAGGRFITADGITVNGIARWDGVNWNNMGNGNTPSVSPEVYSIIKFNSQLFISGAYNNYTLHIQIWNGFLFTPYHSEEIGGANDMEVFNGELYVGGPFHFDTIGQILNYIARLKIAMTQEQDVACFSNCDGSGGVSEIGISPNTYVWSTGDTTQTINNLCAGIYSVTVTDSSGSSSTGTVTVTSPPELVITMDSTNASCSTCNNGTATASASGGSPPYVYQWNNVATTDAIDSLLHGIYTVTVMDNNNCVQIDSVTVGFDVGIEQLIMENRGLIIYPNPAVEQLIIDNGQLIINEIEITDVTGREVQSFKFKVQSDKVVLDVSELASGIYFVKVSCESSLQGSPDGKSVRVGKFVKE